MIVEGLSQFVGVAFQTLRLTAPFEGARGRRRGRGRKKWDLAIVS